MRKIIHYLFSLLTNEKGEGDSFRSMNVSLNMLLLAFFIALNSIAVQDEEHIKKALGSLIGSFGLLPAGVNPGKNKGSQIGPPNAVPMEKIESATAFLRRLENYAIAEGFGKGFGVQTLGELTIMTMTDKMLFEPGGLKIRDKAERFLVQIGAFFQKSGESARIKGHCDSSPPPSGYESNWEYSGAKALAVLRLLTEKSGLAPTAVSAAGHGDSRPLYPNNTRKNRAGNRRIEIVFGKEL